MRKPGLTVNQRMALKTLQIHPNRQDTGWLNYRASGIALGTMRSLLQRGLIERWPGVTMLQDRLRITPAGVTAIDQVRVDA
jgi:hypothetical protein